MKGILSILVVIMCIVASAAHAGEYYVDADTGNDSNAGTSPQAAWKSLAPINAHSFIAGDEILFKAGTRYVGQLAPRGSGDVVDGKVLPITIDMYPPRASRATTSPAGVRRPGIASKLITANLPRIDGEGKVLDTLLLKNVSGWTVQNLEITNHGESPAPWRTGVHVLCDNFGTARAIHLSSMFVHDVNGSLLKTQEGCGIYFEAVSRTAAGAVQKNAATKPTTAPIPSSNGSPLSAGESEHSRFDDLLIENCTVLRTDRNGICQRTTGGGSQARSTHVIIRNNFLEDIGGDGIKLWGSNGGLVEFNTIRGGRIRCTDAAAGIWPFASDESLIQYNEVSGYKGTLDGMAFDSDYVCRRSTFQFNYSHDNEGGFFLICSPGNSYCEDTIIRYNLSRNDGIDSARVFEFGGNSSNTLIHNNTVYIGKNQNLPMITCGQWAGGKPRNAKFYNNIFYVDGKVQYKLGKSSGFVFDHNIFYGNHTAPPADANALTDKPALVNPGKGTNEGDFLTAYEWLPGASVPRGRVIDPTAPCDFFGNRLPPTQPPALGIHEPTSSR